MDELSERLNAVTTGCIMGQAKMNHLMHTDDIVLVSPTAHGLYKLIAVWEQFGDDHNVKFKSTISSILVFKCKLLKNNVYILDSI